MEFTFFFIESIDQFILFLHWLLISNGFPLCIIGVTIPQGEPYAEENSVNFNIGTGVNDDVGLYFIK